MQTDTTATLHRADNGYFQLWKRPCGCTVRVSTEADGFARRNPAQAAKLDAATAARLGAQPCPKCNA